MCVCAVMDNNSNWAVCGKSSGLVSMPVAAMATHKVQMEVMPLFAGHLPYPNIRVFKYLPHHTSPVIPPDTGELNSTEGGLRYTSALDVTRKRRVECKMNQSEIQ